MSSHELIDFMNSASREIEEEYIRIQKRTIEDPGTAGDQGEENWADLLRNWLPPIFHVVTKGRILSYDGKASPQVDILVLQPEYPKQLLNKKLYLANGVLAAFECKLTLQARHIETFFKNSIEIQTKAEKRKGTPYKELQSPIIYGLLAHSHYWKEQSSKPIENIERKLEESSSEVISHPIQIPDLLCVADLACWASRKLVVVDPEQFFNLPPLLNNFKNNGFTAAGYIRYSKDIAGEKFNFTSLGSLFTSLFNKLAWEYPSLRNLSKYFIKARIQGSSRGSLKKWDHNIFSNEVIAQIEAGKLNNKDSWDEWSQMII